MGNVDVVVEPDRDELRGGHRRLHGAGQTVEAGKQDRRGQKADLPAEAGAGGNDSASCIGHGVSLL